MTHRGVTQRGVTQRGVTHRGVTQRGVTHRDVTYRGVTRRARTAPPGLEAQHPTVVSVTFATWSARTWARSGHRSPARTVTSPRGTPAKSAVSPG